MKLGKGVIMRFGYLRRDDSSHWYLVPEERIEEHDKLWDSIEELEYGSEGWYAAINTHEEVFGKCRINGVYDLRIVID